MWQFLFFFFALVGWSAVVQATPNLLQGIRLSSLPQVEQIQLEFAQNFQEEPIVNFEPGALNVRLLSTRLADTVQENFSPKENTLIRSIRTSQPTETDFIQLEIIFHNSRMALGNPEIIRDGRFLYLDLQFLSLQNVELQALERAAETESILEEVGQKVREGDLFPSTFSKPSEAEVFASRVAEPIENTPPNLVSTMVTLVLALVFILLLIYLLAFLYNRFLAGKIPAFHSQIKIRQISTYHIGPKQKVIVLDINGQSFACGITPTSINLLTKVEDSKDQRFLSSLELQNGAINIDQSRSDFLKTLDLVRQQAQETRYQEDISSLQTNRKTEFSNPLQQPSAENKRSLQEQQAVQTVQEEPKPYQFPSATENNSVKLFRTPIYAPFNRGQTVTAEELKNDPPMKDFANRLSEKLKSLKPIK